ncbi:hypothetical protein DFJ58DRAFT_909377 [Suillus subalutaceus]|uniref:uncharacterized protein n=1 Tax=Suillus subalutaceus TaxID=48586 RepID=UPI001B87D1D4|nr:uncharacterized protein DFJ58DRAFT_909377 [Suillus subalutaceus]KAG1877614.1 hypothetical protein DFJ58DRAFT_909377 [Suillus subalutaceus]
MNRIATRQSDMTQTAVNRAYTIQCGRCQAVIEYDTHAGWPTISLLVNEHLGTCPAKLDFHEPAPSHLPSETYGTENAPSHNFDDNMGADNSKHDIQVIAGCRKLKTEARRKRELEDDEYTYSVRPTSVRCHGCEKEISLDKRSRYYPGLWSKHRRKCRGIQKMEKDKLDKPATSGDSVCPWSAGRRSTASSSFEIHNPRADDVLRVANSSESNVSRQTELSDDEDPEEGDQDIPFSTLNEQFYNECLQRGDRPWAYRYSTTKEIKERTIGTVYFDTAITWSMTFDLACAMIHTPTWPYYAAANLKGAGFKCSEGTGTTWHFSLSLLCLSDSSRDSPFKFVPGPLARIYAG